MLKISKLFEETKREAASKLISKIPHWPPPQNSTDRYKKDIDSVKHYYSNPCLRSGFLDTSHQSVKQVFKQYCKESGLILDWQNIKILMKELKLATRHLKNQYKRPRPKSELLNHSNLFKKIKDMDSYSYPSGHTSQAYFLANIIGDMYPEARADLESIAALIGQSRIENAVHYPSDVEYGRLVGEICAKEIKNHDLEKKRKRSSDKKFAKFLRAYKASPVQSANSIANFLINTLTIENLSDRISYAECLDAAKNLMTASPDNMLSKNPLVLSQCKALREAYFLKNYSFENARRIHTQFEIEDLEKGIPGELRGKPHSSPSGIKYCDPGKIYFALNKLENCDDPVLRHILFECVHPFCDGNGRAGRIILCQDTRFDFDEVCAIIGENYIQNLDYFYHNNDIARYFM